MKTSSVTPDAKSQKIIQLLKNAKGRPLSMSDIQRQGQFSSQTSCRTALFKLLAEGKIIAERLGFYWVFYLPNLIAGEHEELFIAGIGWVKKAELRKLVNPTCTK